MSRRSDDEYASWSEFRYQIRCWLRLSEEAARAEGISPQHHQVLLAVRGFPSTQPPLITDVAERLQLRHHSVVGLLDRMETDGLVRREAIGIGRGTGVIITPEGHAALDAISDRLRPDLAEAAKHLIVALTPLVELPRRPRRAAAPRTTVATPSRATRAARGSAQPRRPR